MPHESALIPTRAGPSASAKEVVMPRVLLRTMAAAVILVLPGAWAGVASSQVTQRHQVVLKDGRDDVWECSEKCRLAGDVPTADVVKLWALHGPKRVTFRMYFNDLKRVDNGGFYFGVKTSQNLERIGMIETWPGHWEGRHYLLNSDGDDVRSRGITHRVRYDLNTVTIVIPRGLLGNPRWIRVSPSNDLATDDGFYMDNPMNDQPAGDYSIRLYRSKVPIFMTRAGQSQR